jgi:hypothetical protein
VKTGLPACLIIERANRFLRFSWLDRRLILGAAHRAILPRFAFHQPRQLLRRGLACAPVKTAGSLTHA